MEAISGFKLKDYYIPDSILLLGSKEAADFYSPTCPVIVFVNSKSGGQLGGELLTTYRSLLNRNQVFDLGEKAPDVVLHQLYANIKILKKYGDKLASEIDKRLRIIVAGGDGTASWLLGVISDLKLPRPPPVATVPLGTGNNLPFSFGWGKKNPGTDLESVRSFLRQVSTATEMKIDSWHMFMRMKIPKGGPCDPIGPLELPHSLQAFQRVSSADKLSMEGYHTFRGGFWNYFSMGMDSQVSYAFHSERKIHPEKFKNQLANQRTYLKLGCTQGWFCASLFHPSSRNIAQLARVNIMRRHGHWEELHIPQSIRSIVCLNLPSFSGGLNPWGKPDQKKSCCRDLTPPFVDDGLMEIVGFRDAWHGLVLLAPNGHGTRLAQTSRVRFEFHKGAVDHTYMRLDGEPWKQPLPVDDETMVVEISHSGQMTMLATPLCKSRSIYNPASPMKVNAEEEDNSENDDWEERRMFGAASTFKLPEGVDFAHFS
ncbi:hypothetical protein MLD38_035222 [Melastoma candidum]|uniref:Uncharacterized protein n=1 Tax=Melastoma candidum TaxID=119954 RepID=A0ACB9MCL8_9MYRT|nr:hypothetical protein MLD38_035222 [Melastoma candidum]